MLAEQQLWWALLCFVKPRLPNEFNYVNEIKEKLLPKIISSLDMLLLWHIPVSKLTIETLEQGVKYVQAYFTSCSGVSIVNFEHLNADWDRLLKSVRRFCMSTFLHKNRLVITENIYEWRKRKLWIDIYLSHMFHFWIHFFSPT